jgi:hypothetical protein
MVAWSVGYEQNNEQILLSCLAGIIKRQQTLLEVNMFILENSVKFGLPRVKHLEAKIWQLTKYVMNE